MPDVIILNKILNGTRWTQDPKNIPHEIIDFLMPDGGQPDEGYVFLVPDGAGPDPKKTAKLLVLTTNKIPHEGYYILAVIELRDRLHDVQSVKKGKKGLAAFDSRWKRNLENYKRNAPNITFGDKKLDDLFGPGIHVTYKAGKIYRPTKPIEISSEFYPEGQHPKAVLDEGTPNFEFINNLVSNLDTNSNFKSFERLTLSNEENSLRKMTEKLREEFYGETGRGRTSSINDDDSENKGEKPVMNNQDNKLLPRNLIYFGAPGTGKSYQLKVDVEGEKDKDGKPVRGKEGHFDKDHFERVTFYPTYSYAQFVGCYKPTMESDKAPILSPEQLVNELKIALSSWPQWLKIETGASRTLSLAILLFGEKFYDSLEPLEDEDQKRILKGAGRGNDYDQAYLEAGIAATKVRRRTSGTSGETIVYKFVPGPFLRVLVNALNEKPGEDGKKKNWCLVIEEINRANAAAVFGDVFQLLDRNDKGESEYDVAASEDIRKYLAEVITSQEARNFLAVKTDDKGNWTDCRLRIPSNMYIWATMNSADQGVFPMDTAFKRRWTFKYFQIDKSDEDVEKRIIGTNSTYQWTGNDSMKRWNNVRKFVNRLLTLFKVNEDKLMGPWFVQPESGDEISAEQFESKVLMYLWEDAARMCRQKMFPNSVTSYSELITEWRKHGVGIFDHLMGDNQIGGKDKNTDNSATKLWGALDMPKQQQ